MAVDDGLNKKVDLRLIQEVTDMQLCSLCFQSIQAVPFRSESADDRNTPAQKSPGKEQSQALTNPRDKDWITVHGSRIKELGPSMDVLLEAAAQGRGAGLGIRVHYAAGFDAVVGRINIDRHVFSTQ